MALISPERITYIPHDGNIDKYEGFNCDCRGYISADNFTPGTSRKLVIFIILMLLFSLLATGLLSGLAYAFDLGPTTLAAGFVNTIIFITLMPCRRNRQHTPSSRPELAAKFTLWRNAITQGYVLYMFGTLGFAVSYTSGAREDNRTLWYVGLAFFYVMIAGYAVFLISICIGFYFTKKSTREQFGSVPVPAQVGPVTSMDHGAETLAATGGETAPTGQNIAPLIEFV